MEITKAEIKRPSGEVFTVEVGSFQTSGSAVEIVSTDNKRYVTDLANVLLVTDDAQKTAQASESADKGSLPQQLVDIVRNLRWEFTDDGATIEGKAFIENTSGTPISGLTIQVQLMDDDNQLLDTQTVYVTDWPAGGTQEITFKTNKRFSTYTWFVESFLL